MKAGELVLVGPVVIHYPDFLDSRTCGTNESDLRLRNTGQAAGQFADDFVGKLMGELADLRVRGTAPIDLADHWWSGGAAHVKEPGLDSDFGGGFGQIAEADIVGVGGQREPGRSINRGRERKHLGKVEARACELE